MTALSAVSCTQLRFNNLPQLVNLMMFVMLY